jgi:hypothetical protein
VSHAADWRCRACGALLGHVRGGVLRTLAPVGLIDGRGVARVPCPKCRRVRSWLPAGAPAATAEAPPGPPLGPPADAGLRPAPVRPSPPARAPERAGEQGRAASYEAVGRPAVRASGHLDRSGIDGVPPEPYAVPERGPRSVDEPRGEDAMATETATRVVERMARDEAFREEIRRDPTGALAGYDLTDEEKRSLIGQSGASDLGVDDRTTKFI